MWQEYPFLSGKETKNKPCIGISACLCGERVRYDGTSKIQPDLINQLDSAVCFKPLCPEVAIGMSIPRPPIQLQLSNSHIEAVYVDDQSKSFTRPLTQIADQLIKEDNRASGGTRLCGYIFKSRSPSCGAGSTPVFADGVHVRFADGIYAHKIRQELPWLPAMEEEELAHPRSLNRFLFLVYLVNDYYEALRRFADEQPFFSHHRPLINRLPRRKRTQLDASLETGRRPSEGTPPADYALTVLTESLMETSHQELETLVSNAGNNYTTKKREL